MNHLTATQVETFQRCGRRWWWTYVRGHVQPPGKAIKDGEQGHALLARWYEGRELPGRVPLGKAVRAAIESGNGPDTEGAESIEIEARFDGGRRTQGDGSWRPFDPDATLKLGGVLFDGFVDLRFLRDGELWVVDHKFVSDVPGRVEVDPAPQDRAQLILYAADSLRKHPTVKHVHLCVHYVQRSGTVSHLQRIRVTREAVRTACRALLPTFQKMVSLRACEREADVPYNQRACLDYGGCPHQSRCAAFQPEPRETMTETDLSALDEIDLGIPTGKPKPKLEIHAADPDLTPPASAGKLQPPADSVPPAEAAPVCDGCGVTITRENGSKLRSTGAWKHVGCPVDAPPAGEAPPVKRGPGRPRKNPEVGATRKDPTADAAEGVPAAVSVPLARYTKEPATWPAPPLTASPPPAEPAPAPPPAAPAVNPTALLELLAGCKGEVTITIKLDPSGLNLLTR